MRNKLEGDRSSTGLLSTGAVRYPLVLFIADSWCMGPDCLVPLAQGYGGTVWAFPSEQNFQECFVLVPHFPGPVIAEDDFTVRHEVEVVKELIDCFCSLFPIDKKRIYYTGQSMGVLAGCELSIRYPNLFSACLMISGFWNPDTMPALKEKNMWFFISESDFNSAPKAEKMIKSMENSGAKVGHYFWDGNSDFDLLNQEAAKAAIDGNNIKSGCLFTSWKRCAGGSCHVSVRANIAFTMMKKQGN